LLIFFVAILTSRKLLCHIRCAWQLYTHDIGVNSKSWYLSIKFFAEKESTMKIDWNIFRNLSLALALMLPLAACEQEGPMERAGEQIDETTGQITEEAETATEEAGEAIEEAGDRMGGGTQ
jgi:hypothetical protein